MDKLAEIAKLGSLRRWLIAVLVSVFSTLSVAAQVISWSFEQHPHPFIEDMTPDEHGFSVALEFTGTYLEYCEKMIENNFKIYNDRYPEFQQSGDPASSFQNWKTHMVTPPARFASSCIIGGAFRAINYLSPDPGFYFCGQYTRSPISTEENALQSGLNEILIYANTGLPFAIKSLLVINDEIPYLVTLNPDVKYYFSVLAEKHRQNDDDNFLSRLWNLVDLSPNLPAERKIFVELAAHNFDLASVLETTSACKVRN